MPADPGTPTLDQLRVFLTVVEVGSFAGAARKLGRTASVSVIRSQIWRRSLGSDYSIASRRANRH
jgi:hypothetical protein